MSASAEAVYTSEVVAGPGAPPIVVVPLRVRQRTVGLIVIWELLAQKPGLVDLDYELLQLLGAHAGSALEASVLRHGRDGEIGLSVPATLFEER